MQEKVLSSTTNDQLSLLINRVAATDRGVAERLRLLEAATRSENDDERRKLATLNINDIFNASEFEDKSVRVRYGPGRLLAWFEWIRNVSILFPITLTWFGLSSAANNYNAVITKSPGLESKPFLLLWERGFVELGGIHGPTFSELAWWDFLILAAIVLLTFYIDLKRNVLRVDSLRWARSQREAMELVLWHLNQRLASIRYELDYAKSVLSLGRAVEFFPQQAQALVDQVAAERLRVAELADRRERELGDLHIFTAGLKEGGDQLLSAGQFLHNSLSEFQKTVAALSSQLALQERGQQAIQETLDGLSRHAGSLVNLGQTLGAGFQSSIATIADSASAVAITNRSSAHTLEQATGQMAKLVDDLQRGQSSLQQGLDRVAVHYDAILSGLQQVTEGSVTAGQTLERATGSLELMDPHLRSLAESNLGINAALLDVVRLQQQGTGAIVGSIQKLEDLWGTLSREANDIERHGDALGSALTSFVQMHASDAEQLARLQETNTNLAARLVAIVDEQHASVGRISTATEEWASLSREASRQLSSSVRSLGQQIDNFSQTLESLMVDSVPKIVPGSRRKSLWNRLRATFAPGADSAIPAVESTEVDEGVERPTE